MIHARVRVVGDTHPFHAEVCQGLRQARLLSRLSLDDYAESLTATLGERVTAAQVLAWERGGAEPGARIWFAACRVADQPQSSVIGESELVPAILGLQRQIDELSRILDSDK